MKYLIGFIVGIVATILVYEQETATEVAREVVVDQVVDEVKEIDYTFYENLYQSSVTVIKDAYDAPLKKTAEDLKPNAPKQYLSLIHI